MDTASLPIIGPKTLSKGKLRLWDVRFLLALQAVQLPVPCVN